MAFTYFGSASNPSDNGSASGTVAVTPPASMVAGDLAILIAVQGTPGGVSPIGLSDAGGQSWTAVLGDNVQIESSGVATKLWFCRFNGTWSASPACETTSGSLTVVLHVFTPTAAKNSLFLDLRSSNTVFSLPGVGVPITCPGRTTLSPNAVVIACWIAGDNPTWTFGGEAGWSLLGNAQYRNSTASYNSSLSSAYYLQASPGATGDVTNTQGSLNRSAGYTVSFAVKEESVSVKILGKVKILGAVKVL